MLARPGEPSRLPTDGRHRGVGSVARGPGGLPDALSTAGERPASDHEPGTATTAIADVGIALSAVGLTTIHLSRAEELLRGEAPSDELYAQAGEIAAEDCSPSADGRGPVDYKRHLAGVLTTRALHRATARARSQEAGA